MVFWCLEFKLQKNKIKNMIICYWYGFKSKEMIDIKNLKFEQKKFKNTIKITKNNNYGIYIYSMVVTTNLKLPAKQIFN